MSERTLALELVGVLVADTVLGLKEEGLPNPSRYTGTLVVFGGLAALAAVGPSEARLASTIGAVVFLMILLSPAASGLPKGVAVAGALSQATAGRPGGPIGTSTGISSAGIFTGAGGAPVQQGPSVP